jgi:hypothetical protein
MKPIRSRFAAATLFAAFSSTAIAADLHTDNFYNGTAFDIGLRRHVPAILKGELRAAILPLRKDAPIYLAKGARPEFGNAQSMVALKRVEIVPRYQIQLAAR